MKAQHAVVRMTWDELGRRGWRVNSVPWPKWSEVQAAIDHLDGRRRTVVQLLTKTVGKTLEVMRNAEHFLVTQQSEIGAGGALATLDAVGNRTAIVFRWGDREYVF